MWIVDPETETITVLTLSGRSYKVHGVYKPGDVVHLKGIARNLNENQSTLPVGTTVNVKVNDAKDRQIFNKPVTLSEFGSFAEEIRIPAGSLGSENGAPRT